MRKSARKHLKTILFMVAVMTGLALLTAPVLRTQVSIPNVAEIKLPPGANLLMGYVAGGWAGAKNIRGSFMQYVQRDISGDSLPSHQVDLTITRSIPATSIVGDAFDYEVAIEMWLESTPNARIAYKDTFSSNAGASQLYIPDKERPMVNGANSWLPRDSVWIFYGVDQLNNLNDYVRWKFTHYFPLAVDSTGRLNTHSIFKSTDSLNTY